MAAPLATKYDVGGVLLDRPFKIRRLGHFGLDVVDPDAVAPFFLDLLGFQMTDQFRTGGFFARYGTDHHALVIIEKQAAEAQALASPVGPQHYRAENTINQITFQVQSKREVADATAYFRERGIDINREGRAGGPGGNWHLYVYDPDDQIVELYYGMDQVGWDGFSRPLDMRPPGENEASAAPCRPASQEVDDKLAAGGDPRQGYRHTEARPATYDVDGVLLPRPFKVTRLGPVNLFVDDLEATSRFYQEALGLTLSEEATWQGERCAYLRCDTEHHSIGLFPRALRERLGFSSHTTCMSLGVQVANYRQLKQAVAFLRENDVRVETDLVPTELHPGIDYTAWAFAPDGHCVQLYCYMEQIGWDGVVRPAAQRRRVDQRHWPDTLAPLSDTYSGEPFLGPWA